MGIMKKITLSFAALGLCIGLIVGCAELSSFGKGLGAGAADAGAIAVADRVNSDSRIPEELKPVVVGVAEALAEEAKKNAPPPDPSSSKPLEGLFYTLGGAVGMFAASLAKGFAKKKGWIGGEQK